MSEPPGQRPPRQRRQPGWLADCVTQQSDESAFTTAAPQRALPAAQGRRRPAAAERQPRPAACPSQEDDASDYDDASSDAEGDQGSDEEWEADDDANPESQAESPEAPPKQRQRAGSGAKEAARRPAEYTETERALLVHKASTRLQATTQKAYASHRRKLEKFCKIKGFSLEEAVTAMQVVTILAQCIAWVALGQPGYTYKGKTAKTTHGLLRACRNAFVHVYHLVCLKNRWSDAQALMQTHEFKTEFKSGCAAVLPKKGRPEGDPQKNTAAEALTDDEIMRCFCWFISMGTLAGNRDWQRGTTTRA